MRFADRKNLPDNITSYDLIKTLAIILMIIDHIGMYFYPEELWFRAIGRLCVPIWFFLIGYARSRDFGPSLWIGTAILFVTALLSGMYILPLSILATILCVRALIDRIGPGALSSPQALAGFMICCALLALPTGVAVEYGTLGLSLALYGYMIRQREEREIPMDLQMLCLVMAAFGYTVVQQLAFGFSEPQFLFTGLGCFIIMGVLFFFKSHEFIVISVMFRGLTKRIVQFTGRYTLEIYVGHIVLFRLAALVLYPDRFKIIQPTLFFAS